jgi:cell division protein FtsW (lipid II flippase)
MDGFMGSDPAFDCRRDSFFIDSQAAGFRNRHCFWPNHVIDDVYGRNAGLLFSLLISPLACFFGISHDPVVMLIWFGFICALLLLSLIRRSLDCLASIPNPGGHRIPGGFQYAESVWNQLRDIKKTGSSAIESGYGKKGFNWNIYQSKVALGSGGFWGIGLGKGTK